ncbi:MAG: DUF2007 domain-containing protein [Planctomycetota bacterium]
MSDESNASELVLLTTASNTFEAHLLRNVLEASDIPVHVPGQNASDEWGALMRGTSVRIEVPRGRLEEAKELVDEARAEAAARRDRDDEEDEYDHAEEE